MADRLSDAEIESLLTGSTEAEPALGEVIAGLAQYAEWRPDSGLQADHIAEAVAVVTVPTAEPTDVGNLSSPPRDKEKRMIGRIMSTRLAKALAAALATLLATSGIAWAATGSNPADQVSTVAQQVGHVLGADIDESEDVEIDVEEPETEDVDEIEDGKALVDETEAHDRDDVDETELEDDEVEQDEAEEIDDDHSTEIEEDEAEEIDDDHSTEIEEDEAEEIDDDHSTEVEEDEAEEVDDDHSTETSDDSEHEDDSHDDDGHEADSGHDD